MNCHCSLVTHLACSYCSDMQFKSIASSLVVNALRRFYFSFSAPKSSLDILFMNNLGRVAFEIEQCHRKSCVRNEGMRGWRCHHKLHLVTKSERVHFDYIPPGALLTPDYFQFIGIWVQLTSGVNNILHHIVLEAFMAGEQFSIFNCLKLANSIKPPSFAPIPTSDKLHQWNFKVFFVEENSTST